eukprot:UN01036
MDPYIKNTTSSFMLSWWKNEFMKEIPKNKEHDKLPYSKFVHFQKTMFRMST